MLNKLLLSCLLTGISIVGFGQCTEIAKKVDRFNPKEIVVHTRYDDPFVLIRQLDTGVYYLSLTGPSSALPDDKGVILLLSDGGRLEWPDEKVKISINTGNLPIGSRWKAHAFIEVSKEQVALLAQQSITDIRLNVGDWQPPRRLTERFKEAANCLLITPPDEVRIEK